MKRLSIQQAVDLTVRALVTSGASEPMAQATAKALVQAQAQGIASHGLSRVAQYALHLRNGRADGRAVPTLSSVHGATLIVDAQMGLAFEACQLAVQKAITVTNELGICFAGVINSHHCGVLVDHLRPAASKGFIGLAFANSPAAMPVAGGKHAILGTNPVAAIFPRKGKDPLMIDLSLSEVARGKLMVAAQEGKQIPEGWALDKNGQPTRDPRHGLEGSMLPVGASTSPKGAMIALIVELLVTAVIGSRFGFEANSFFVDEGNAPRIGQAFLLINPSPLAGSSSYLKRIEVLVTEMLVDEGVRLPGARRLELERDAEANGLEIPNALIAQLEKLAATAET